MLKVIDVTASDIEVTEAKGVVGAVVNSVELNDDEVQSQFDRMLRPAIAKVVVPVFLIMIWFPTLLQGTSVYKL